MGHNRWQILPMGCDKFKPIAIHCNQKKDLVVCCAGFPPNSPSLNKASKRTKSPVEALRSDKRRPLDDECFVERILFAEVPRTAFQVAVAARNNFWADAKRPPDCPSKRVVTTNLPNELSQRTCHTGCHNELAIRVVTTNLPYGLSQRTCHTGCHTETEIATDCGLARSILHNKFQNHESGDRFPSRAITYLHWEADHI